jgi:hypothetical protein
VPAESRRNLGGDPGRDEVDPGQELLAVIMPREFRRRPVDERVPGRVEPRPALTAPVTDGDRAPTA